LIWYIFGGLIGIIFFKKKYNLTFWQAVWNGIVFALGLYFVWGTIAAFIGLILGLEEYMDISILGLFIYAMLAFGCFLKIAHLKNQNNTKPSENKKTSTKTDKYHKTNMNKYPKRGKIIETSIAGVTFEGRQEILKSIHIGQPINLVREPQNIYDFDAIKITLEDGSSIGYINKNLARKIAPIIDDMNIYLVQGEISSICKVKNDPSIIGAKIRFQIP